MIDVIIPAYNAHSTIERTLFSICYQTMSDKLNVIIVNDCSVDNYQQIVNFFSMYINIKEVTLDVNSGPGIARERGLQESHSDFVVFIDADDTFASPKAIERLYNLINENEADVAIGSFVECLKGAYYSHYSDLIWLHGKMYRRSFLDENNIHFNDSRANEDNFFNSCIILSDAKMTFTEDPIYIWNYTENSITRKNNKEYNYTGIFGYIDNMSKSLIFGVENNKNRTLIGNRSLSVLYAVYYYYIGYKDEKFIEMSKDIKRIYLDYKNDINDAEKIKKNQYEYALDNGNPDVINNPSISFEEFIERIGE